MGLTYNDARQLLRAKRDGATFATVGTIGRQQLYLHPREVAALVHEFDLDARATWTQQNFGAYADSFFEEALGSTQVTAIDASDYEGATLIIDMNEPLPAEHAEQFDAVVDGGSLEHIFNVPVALASLMAMVRTGGRLFISTPANNLCGHGFYQFSPEFMFRVFSEPHGFLTHDVLLFEFAFPNVEQQPAKGAYKVTDPDSVRDRVGLMSRRAAMLFVHAEKRVHLEAPFATPPQQSDYTARWSDGKAHGSGGGRLQRLPPKLRMFARRHRLKLTFSLRNRRFYKPL